MLGENVISHFKILVSTTNYSRELEVKCIVAHGRFFEQLLLRLKMVSLGGVRFKYPGLPLGLGRRAI